MADPSSHGGAVTANPVETIMKRIRASFRERATLLLSIVKGKGTIVATDYINEDLQSIVKKYETVEKETDLKMLRRPRDVLSRISDPALPSRLGGVVTADVGKSRLDHGFIKYEAHRLA